MKTPLVLLSALAIATPSKRLDFLDEYIKQSYVLDLEQPITQALHRVEDAPGEPWLLVLDIDETAISNLSWLREVKYNTSLEAFEQYAPKGQGVAIMAVKRLYDAAIERGYPVVFMTGRDQRFANVTRMLLHKNGYRAWNDLFFKEDRSIPTWRYKRDHRCQLQDKGYSIINVGDQLSDLVGGCATLSVKLPNPFYDIESVFE